MKLIGLDAEAFYSQDYSLRGMSTPEYIMDPRFSIHGWAVAIPGEAPFWVPYAKVQAFIDRLRNSGPWAIVSHNAAFDMSILAYRFGYYPERYIDTLGMSRALVGGRLRSHSLDSVAKYVLGIDEGKAGGGAALAAVKGLTTAELYTPSYRPLLDNLIHYAKRDITLTMNIFEAFRQGRMDWTLSEDEMEVLDWTVRMMTRPRLRVDLERLGRLHADETERRAALVAAAGVDATSLRSAAKFEKVLAALLEPLGEEVPMKPSPKTPGKMIPAVAISDAGFLDLLEHEDETVRAVAEARRAAQSSILTTRAAKFANIGRAMRGWFPVQLSYAGAVATHRLSGAGGTNVQNLKRGSELRRALVAPKGYLVLTSDLSNIELRTNAALAGQWDAIDALATPAENIPLRAIAMAEGRWKDVNKLSEGKDLYSDFGTFAFGKPVNKKDTPDLRQMAKVAVLCLGYYGGAATLQRAMRWQAGIKITLAQAQELVDAYRARFASIPVFWRTLGQTLRAWLRQQTPRPLANAPFLTWGVDYVEGPSGLRLTYPELRNEVDDIRGEQMVFTSHSKTRADGRKIIHAGLLCENLNQWLAREVITEQALRLKRAGLMPVMQVHDELVFVVKESEIDAARTLVTNEMSRSPDWWPELPVACETGVGVTYGDAK